MQQSSVDSVRAPQGTSATFVQNQGEGTHPGDLAQLVSRPKGT